MTDEELLDLILAGERQLRGAFIEVVAFMREANTLASLERAVVNGDLAGALNQLSTAADSLAAAVEQQYLQAAQATARTLPGRRFTISDPAAVAEMQALRLNRVTAFTYEQEQLVRQVMLRGMTARMPAASIARQLRDSIGLTPAQELIVQNYRRQLETGQYGAAGRRQNHDDRFSRAFPGAAARGGLRQEQTDRMVDRYRNNWVATRANTLAETLAVQAIHQGQEAVFAQALARGTLLPQQLLCVWHAGSPPVTRDWHASMNGQRRGWGVPFLSGIGNLLMHPGDPRAPGADTINCQCRRVVKVRI